MQRLTVYFAFILYLASSCWAGIVYSNDFSTAPGAGLSLTSGPGALALAQTPATCVSNASAYCGTFLGLAGSPDNIPLTSHTVTLTLTDLGAHDTVDLNFLFFALNSWDGNLNMEGAGPDRFQVKVDGQTAVDSTFTNVSFFQQDYPNSFGSGSFAAQTGAVETNKLGSYTWGDAVYGFTFSFTHTAPTLTVTWSGIGLQGWPDEGWGIDNVVVSTSGDVYANNLDANVPEPGSLGLAAMAFGIVALTMRRFRV